MDEDTKPTTIWTESNRIYDGIGWGDPWGFIWGVGSFEEMTYSDVAWSEITSYG